MSRKPNNYLAPIVIAGITVGFFVSAYKFVFKKDEPASSETVEKRNAQPDQELNLEQSSKSESTTDLLEDK